MRKRIPTKAALTFMVNRLEAAENDASKWKMPGRADDTDRETFAQAQADLANALTRFSSIKVALYGN